MRLSCIHLGCHIFCCSILNEDKPREILLLHDINEVFSLFTVDKLLNYKEALVPTSKGKVENGIVRSRFNIKQF